MKRCPQCGSLVFDDLNICYDCMYRFGGSETSATAAAEHHGGEPEPDDEVGLRGRALLSLLGDDEAIPIARFTVRLGKRLIMGNSRGCDVILNAEKVSARHVQLIHDPDGGLIVVDLGTSGSTRVNGVAVRVAEHLYSGDMLQIGETRIRIEDDGSGTRRNQTSYM